MGEEVLHEGLNTRQEVTYKEVKENQKKSQKRIREKKEAIGQKDHFQRGDMVLRRNIREQQRFILFHIIQYFQNI